MENKEIKFRAWDNNAMYKVKEITFVRDQTDSISDMNGGRTLDILLVDEQGNEVMREYLKNLNLMQYTGLKDRNEQEIYEGDIVSTREFTSNGHLFKDILDIVDNKDGVFVGVPFIITYQIDGERVVFEYRADRCEIVGNIYENPNLLKKLNEQKSKQT